ncbi:hypothetical protein COOONC_10923, partial [Cooperia oncophora]
MDFLKESDSSSKKEPAKKKASSSSSRGSKQGSRGKPSKKKRKESVMVHLKKEGKRSKMQHIPNRTQPDSKALDLFPKPARVSSAPDQGTPLNKLQKIAMGAKKDKDAYPTFDDIKSDWDDEKKEKIKPKKMDLDDKQKIIAMGAKKDTSAYPTMDDIMSDWDSSEDDKKGPKKK